MQTITQPPQVLYWEFQLFMVNTLAFQLEKWATFDPNATLIKEHREAIKHLRNKCRKLIDLNNGTQPKVEERFYEIGDKFHAILGLIQKQSDAHSGFYLLELCNAVATNDFEFLKKFFLESVELFNPEPAQMPILSAIQMYCPEMSKEKKQSFAKLLQLAK